MDKALIVRLLAATEVLRAPARRLATFGATRIDYHLISPVEDMPDRTRVREGVVVSAKPAILTPESLRERFEGFGDEGAELARWASTAYRDLLRALEYNFRNQGQAARVLHDSPLLVAERLTADLDARGVTDKAVIRCPDAGWSLALMKFTLDEAARSFPGHVADLERRGRFAPDGGEGERRRREVEALFAAAAGDPVRREALGRKLKDYGLFAEYEDRFLGLFS
ncbi:MAG: hypothetical protein SF051_03845 [Elusimicrobiota bacterium]|nr:hypothetical protein [Elusimicrobiota bacterium]